MSFDTTAPIPGWPPAQPVPPQPAKRRTRLWAMIAGGVALVGLVVGLLVWQPWNPPPNPPTGVSLTSSTATSVLVSWVPAKGGATPASYVIYRDGKQVGTVSASKLSWTDTGLQPGSKHAYRVAAVGDGQQSGQTKAITVTTITPPPVGLATGKATWTSVDVHWAASPDGPEPTQYVVYNGTTQVAAVPGTTDSYELTGLTTGQKYQVSVAARWGSTSSAPSTSIQAGTLDAPLSGSVPLTVKVTSTPGSGASLTVGEHWTDTWQFSANCSSTSCTLSNSAEFDPPDLQVKQFTIKMSPSSGGYSGSTTAEVTKCGSVTVHNTISVSVYPNSGAVSNGGWTKWNGTMTLSSPYTTASSSTFCPAQSWHFSLSGSGS
jgi:Fibronectin type III domain